MKRLVVDASVLAMLFFDEDHSQAAERLLDDADKCHAPDHIWNEIANVIWKQHRHGTVDAAGARDILTRAMQFPLVIHSSAELLADALEFAISYDRTAYDSLYVALAVKVQYPLITNDKRLVNAMSRTPLARQVRWIGDIPQT